MIFLNWTMPFTFNITGVSLDITYCVNVFVDLLISNDQTTLDSTCEINTTTFSYPIPAESICSIIMFRVTPVNLYGDGDNATAPFTRYKHGEIVRDIIVVHSLFVLCDYRFSTAVYQQVTKYP
jgi:hypothetical protein